MFLLRNPYHGPRGHFVPPAGDAGQAGRVYALRRIDRLPDGPTAGTKQSPFECDETGAGLLAKSDPMTQTIEDVPVSSLVATRPTIQVDLAKGYVDRTPAQFTDGQVPLEDSVPGRSPIPIVVEHEGKHYLADGHHRATAAWARGSKTVRALKRTTARTMSFRERMVKMFGGYQDLIELAISEGRFDLERDEAEAHKKQWDTIGRNKDLGSAKSIYQNGAKPTDETALKVISILGPQFEHALKEKLDAAPQAQKEMQDGIAAVMKSVGGSEVPYTDTYEGTGIRAAVGAPKGLGRLIEKTVMDYDGDLNRVKDIVRSSIAVDTLDQVAKVKAEVGKHFEVLKVKNRFAMPTKENYRDMMITTRSSNGLVGEIQIHVKPILKAKEEAHKIYAVMRSGVGSIVGAMMMDKMADLFNGAWKQALTVTAASAAVAAAARATGRA